MLFALFLAWCGLTTSPGRIISYQSACDPVNVPELRAEAIAAVVEACKDGAKIVDLCKLGDDTINKWVQCSKACCDAVLLSKAADCSPHPHCSEAAVA